MRTRTPLRLTAAIAVATIAAGCATTDPAAAQPPSDFSYAAEPKGDGYLFATDIPYRTGDDLNDYARERCELDVYFPETTDHEDGFPTVVWFHGGGLTEGDRFLPGGLMNQGIAVVIPSYRLHPNVTSPTYVEDAAAAVAWTMDNIESFGGDPDKIFVSGHSAGGYLASMVGMDKRWLAAHDKDPDTLAGLIPLSGHTITHFTIRRELGLEWTQGWIDDMAPQYHVRAGAPPILLITGDRDLELLGRYEENAYFWRMMQVVGHPDCEIFELEGFDHGGMIPGSLDLSVRFINRIIGQD